MEAKNLHVAVAALALLTTSCGGTSGSAVTTSGPGSLPQAGIALPREVSALPPLASAAPSPSLTAASSPAPSVAAFGADTDYAKAEVAKLVNESSLSRFEVLNNILRAMAQTHYEDPAVVGRGPYLAMVSWTEDQGWRQVKQVVQWQVESWMTKVAGVDVNRVQVYFPRTRADGAAQLTRIQLDVVEPPRMSDDGVSYADYGRWSLVTSYFGGWSAYLAATADRNAGGTGIVKIHEYYPPGTSNGIPWETKGVLHRSGASGAGRVVYPGNQCPTPPSSESCQTTSTEVTYVYDGSTVTLKDGADPVISRDRTRVVDLVNRYGLFDAATGAAADIDSGFPVLFDDAQGVQRMGYYGSWQGRHQLWKGDPENAALPPGTVVTRADVAPGKVAPSYATSGGYTGILVKRELVPASIAEITGLYLEIFITEAFRLYPDGQGGWCRKEGTVESVVYNAERFSCATPDARPFTEADFAAFDMDYSGATPRGPTAVYWDWQAGVATILMYVWAGPWGPAGFYEAEFSGVSLAWELKLPFTPFVPPAQELELAMITSRRAYISWNGLEWVQKQLLSIDPATWVPTFGPDDTPYILELGREYPVYAPGGSYIVTRTDAGFEVRAELLKVANPVNLATFLEPGTTFREAFVPMGGRPSEYRYGTDKASADFMRLSYLSVGEYAPPEATAGTLVTNPKSGLLALRDGQPTGLQFNWEYPVPGASDGVQEFLLDGEAFLLLDDPLRFAAIPLVNGAGQARHYQLQFDGNWLQGLPDIYREIGEAGSVVTQAIADKAVVIPDGTGVTDPIDGRTYVFKQLQIDEYLYPTGAEPLDLAPASALSLDDLPGYVDPVPPMRQMDPNARLLYSEGKPVG
jgi:hypothetical protein